MRIRRKVAPGATFTVLDVDGPGTISHIWFTIADNEPYHLKRIVLRIYWDGESHAQCRSADRRLLRPGPGRPIISWQSEDAVGGQREGAEQLFPHAVCASRAHHRHQ